MTPLRLPRDSATRLKCDASGLQSSRLAGCEAPPEDPECTWAQQEYSIIFISLCIYICVIVFIFIFIVTYIYIYIYMYMQGYPICTVLTLSSKCTGRSGVRTHAQVYMWSSDNEEPKHNVWLKIALTSGKNICMVAERYLGSVCL